MPWEEDRDRVEKLAAGIVRLICMCEMFVLTQRPQ